MDLFLAMPSVVKASPIGTPRAVTAMICRLGSQIEAARVSLIQPLKLVAGIPTKVGAGRKCIRGRVLGLVISSNKKRVAILGEGAGIIGVVKTCAYGRMC